MECKHCNGTGTTNVYINGTFMDCPYCGGTGKIEVEQTNDEWLSGLPIKEKALFLARLYGHSRMVELSELLFRHNAQDVEDDADIIEKWLKEKHI